MANVPATEKMMTAAELAAALNVSPETIRANANTLFPGLNARGKTTYYNESQAVAIKKMIESSGRRDLQNVLEVGKIKSELEMQAQALEVMTWMQSTIKDLQSKIAQDAPLVESARAMARCDDNMSISQASKFFALHPKLQVFPFLRIKGYLLAKDIPSQLAISQGLLALRDNVGPGGSVFPQAVVTHAMLETWRTYLVPRIVEWLNEGGF